MFDNKAKIPLTCSECGNRWSETFGQLRKDSVTCPSCKFPMNTAEFAKSMGGAEQKLKRFGR